ncbi:MAG: urea transport system ATP-binding protein, partial [Betaproteobacteria bacterium]
MNPATTMRAMSGVGSGDMSIGHPVLSDLDASHGVVLYLDSISVSFDGFKALNALTLAIDVGELRC